MALMGTVALFIAFVICAISAGTLIVSACLRTRAAQAASSVGWVGRICAIATFAALTVCCGVLVICFMNGDNSIQYVVEQRSNSTGELAWLYKLSGLWAGRQGSLLFWAWLIAAFNAYVAFRHLDSEERLDDVALGISQLVALAFLALLLFSGTNMPFVATPSTYFDANGQLIGSGLLGMNVLLEHWAMAVHPPTLFIGYAGLTLPFAYAIAALVCNDGSSRWVMRVNGITSFAWLFLGVGIGLGAVWAYVVLGWGGYWGWDPVENASLLSWLVCTALLHSFTLYRTHGAFKRWSLVCACFTFMFVIVGTFISRSGVVQSVHAFSGDQVSLVLFVALIIISGLAGILSIFARRKSFDAADARAASSGKDGFFSKEMGYFLGNVILVVGAFALAYLTLASALPTWMPLGGQSIGAGTYNSLARPLGIFLLLIVALGPLMGWKRTDAKQFWKNARIPGICATLLFAVLVIYFFIVLLPVYSANISAGDAAAAELAALGPAWYYNGLALAGFAVASMLVFNSLYLFVRALRSARTNLTSGKETALEELGHQAVRMSTEECASQTAERRLSGFERFRRRAATLGGMLVHASMGVMLIGLIGSSMYVTEHSGYLAASSVSEAPQEFIIQDYALVAVDANAQDAGGDGYLYSITLDISKGGEHFGQATPVVQVDSATMQQKLVADVISSPLQDLFVVFRGMNAADDFSLDVRVNPLISLVWLGFALFVIGSALACLAKRPHRREHDAAGTQEGEGVRVHEQ